MRKLLVLTALVAFGCDSGPAIEAAPTALEGTDQRAYREVFLQAVCVCEAQNYSSADLASGPLNPDLVPADDVGLTTVLQERADGTLSCDPLPPRVRRADPSAATSGCIDSWPVPGGAPGPYTEGFCRADFNHCLANELRLSAERLVGAPRSREVRDALLSESRRRFQTSALEMSAALAYLSDNCRYPDLFGPERQRVFNECERLRTTSYGNHAVGVIESSVLAMTEIIEEEAINAAATGESFSPGLAESRRAYVEQIWGSESARWAVAQGLMGDAERTAYGITNREGVSALEQDGVFADRAELDEHAALALELMQAFDVPLGVVTNRDGIDPQVLEAPSAGSPLFDEALHDRARFNLLDHRVAARLQVGPYALAELPDDAFDPTSDTPFAPRGAGIQSHDPMSLGEFEAYARSPLPGQSVLRSEYGLSEADVAAGYALARNLLTTLDVDYRLQNQVELRDGRWLAAVRFLSVHQRSRHRLAAALQNLEPEGVPLVADPLAYVDQRPIRTLGGSVSNLYSFDAAQTERMGGADAVHVLRTHLRRLQRASRAADVLQIPRDDLGPLVEMTESYVGERWFELSGYRDGICHCIGASCARLTTSDSVGYLDCSLFTASSVAFRRDRLSNEAHWTAYYPAGDSLADPAGEAVLVRSRDEAFCIQHGHYPDGSRQGCQTDDELLPTSRILQRAPGRIVTGDGRPSARRALGVEMSRFIIPEVDTYTMPGALGSEGATAYIFWRRTVDGRLTYELMDVVQPRRTGSVHVFDGRFGELFQELWGKIPSDPGRPAMTSLGLASDLIPPLENELTSDGDVYEDSFQAYLNNATVSAENAESLLRQARRFELDALQNDRADAALLEEAALAERDTLSAACGDIDGCELERRESVTLAELTVEGEPYVTPLELGVDDLGYVDLERSLAAGEPWVTIEARDAMLPEASCLHHMGAFIAHFVPDQVPKRQWGMYVEEYMGAALSCSRFYLRNAAAEATLHDVPEVVIEELAAGGPGEFAEFSGEVRQPLIQLYQDLLDLRETLRGFEATYQISVSELIQARRALEENFPDRARVNWCKIGRAMAVIGTVVAAAVASYVTFGAAAAVIVAAVVVASAASAAGAIAGVATADKCSGNTERGEQLLQRAFAGTILSLENLRGLTDDVRRLLGRTAIADSQMDTIQRRAELAAQRRVVAEQIIDSNALADIPEWRALQSFRVERARAALRRAQRFAFVARRATEFRLVEELPFIVAPEPFTEAPTIWANDLFTVDTATSADGDASDTATQHVNTSGEALVDYVQKLQDFVRGYPFGRRFRDASDSQTLSLRSMSQSTVDEDSAQPFFTTLSYKCNDLPATIQFEADETPCAELGGVEYAEYRFSVPAHFDEYLANRLAVGNFNYRHERLALNMVGTAFVDCERATRPGECYGDGNVRYDLRQDGRVYLQAYDFSTRAYEMEPGVIVDGRALAAERVLTNPLSSADRSLVEPYRRTELWGRPIRGVYTIRVEGGPEVVWRNLEDIQLLLQYRYWTRQT